MVFSFKRFLRLCSEFHFFCTAAAAKGLPGSAVGAKSTAAGVQIKSGWTPGMPGAAVPIAGAPTPTTAGAGVATTTTTAPLDDAPPLKGRVWSKKCTVITTLGGTFKTWLWVAEEVELKRPPAKPREDPTKKPALSRGALVQNNLHIYTHYFETQLARDGRV